MFLMLEIEDGLTILSFSCGSQNVVSMEEGLRVDDGVRHTITVGYNSKIFSQQSFLDYTWPMWKKQDWQFSVFRMQWYQSEHRQMICNVSMQLDQWPPLTGQQHDVVTLCEVSVVHLGMVHGKESEELDKKIGFTGCIDAVLVNLFLQHLIICP